jgi:hypothetical protein
MSMGTSKASGGHWSWCLISIVPNFLGKKLSAKAWRDVKVELKSTAARRSWSGVRGAGSPDLGQISNLNPAVTLLGSERKAGLNGLSSSRSPQAWTLYLRPDPDFP